MEKKQDNVLVNLLVNIVIPTIVLTKFSKEAYLGPVYGLIVALAFPLVYGLYDMIIQKHKNFISILGVVSILISGVVGLLKFPPQWIAIKEAAIPFLIGVIILLSTKTSWQLVSKLIFNRELLNIDLIEEKLNTNELKSQLKSILTQANIFLAFSFFFSSILNFILAKMIVHSMPGTTEFNAEMGRMTMLSFPVIAVPSMVIVVLIFWYLMSSLKKLTQLTMDEIMSEKFRG
jgi:hypothetical protein